MFRYRRLCDRVCFYGKCNNLADNRNPVFESRSIFYNIPLCPQYNVGDRACIYPLNFFRQAFIGIPTKEDIPRLLRVGKRDRSVFDGVFDGICICRAVGILIYNGIFCCRPISIQLCFRRDIPGSKAPPFAIRQFCAAFRFPTVERITGARGNGKCKVCIIRCGRCRNRASAVTFKGYVVYICCPIRRQRYVACDNIVFKIPYGAIALPTIKRVARLLGGFGKRLTVFLDLLRNIGKTIIELIGHRIDLASSNLNGILLLIQTIARNYIDIVCVVALGKRDRCRRNFAIACNIRSHGPLRIRTHHNRLGKCKIFLFIGDFDRKIISFRLKTICGKNIAPRSIAFVHPFRIQHNILRHRIGSEVPFRIQIGIFIPPHKYISCFCRLGRFRQQTAFGNGYTVYGRSASRVECYNVLLRLAFYIFPFCIDAHVTCQLFIQQRISREGTFPSILIPIPSVKQISVFFRIIRQTYCLFPCRINRCINFAINNKL